MRSTSAVEREVEELRLRTQALVEELERRVRQGIGRTRGAVAKVKHAVDLRAQFREHHGPAIGISAGVVIAVGIGIYFAVERRRAARRPMARLRRRAEAWRLLLGRPRELLRKREPIGRRVLIAALSTAATVLVRRSLERLTRPLVEPRRRELPAHT